MKIQLTVEIPDEVAATYGLSEEQVRIAAQSGLQLRLLMSYRKAHDMEHVRMSAKQLEDYRLATGGVTVSR